MRVTRVGGRPKNLRILEEELVDEETRHEVEDRLHKKDGVSSDPFIQQTERPM